jgi:hypothetical protein
MFVLSICGAAISTRVDAATSAKEGSISFLKKETKNFCPKEALPEQRHASNRVKVFWFFFSKKNFFPNNPDWILYSSVTEKVINSA